MTAVASNAFKEIQYAQNRTVPNWAQLAELFRRVTYIVKSQWAEMPSGARAVAELMVYHPEQVSGIAPVSVWRRLVSAVAAGLAYSRNDPNFLEYIENVVAFRRAVMDAAEKHDSIFQQELAETIASAVMEIESSDLTPLQTEADIREWLDRNRLSSQ